MEGKILFMYALSPLHTGTGQSVGIVDLPIARERTTSWPFIPGSSIKGVFRDVCNSEHGDLVVQAFGPETGDQDSAGALFFCDAHILCMPIRSFKGSFAWVSCDAALKRLRRDYVSACGCDPFKVIENNDYQSVILSADSKLIYNEKVYLEDIDLSVSKADAGPIAKFLADRVFSDEGQKKDFRDRFAIVDNDMFTDLVKTCTEVAARIRIDDDSKTANKETGALWYEESVPAESIFWLPVLAEPRNGMEADKLFCCVDAGGKMIQIGGHASVGRGLMLTRLDDGGK